MQPVVVFSDLDGTLLNHADYSFQAAEPALAELKEQKIPLVLVSSKTAPEMLRVREALGNTHPFVCENGSLVMIPQDRVEELGVEADDRSMSDGYYYDYRGIDREQILQVLNGLKSDYQFTGFAWMTDEEIGHVTGLSLEEAGLAGQRKASEPILWRDDPEQLDSFTEVLAENKLRLIQGGRFYHVLGQCDKGNAVSSLLARYEQLYQEKPYCIALGDSPNDLDMLKFADAPVLIPNENGACMNGDALKHVTRAPKEGAEGWNAAVLEILDSLRNRA
ncbi:mannosyl-3-phosphoglycerate phosphatase [Marinimicrobium sp. ABcell2]|uniref:HAD-IIB family hydrolase n=1 Tax=Marinimicrobium sp. ABcell2 TaxID=3069751 RepID=UPI0027B7D693|nr:HAD-IIB family hydrolase [Marinimicrobium sp. ABcell2]MDQ2077708.1 HAD-IIB family hydrolase [Marinimicrobium sp. ABcell2]